MVKNPPAVRETQRHEFNPQVRKIPLEEGMAIHSSILAWRTLWTERPAGLQSMGVTKSRTVETEHTHMRSLESRAAQGHAPGAAASGGPSPESQVTCL